MPEAKFEKPVVTHTPSGAGRVKAADILLSRQGQLEISKAASVAVSHHLRKNGSLKSPNVKKT